MTDLLLLCRVVFSSMALVISEKESKTLVDISMKNNRISTS
jgi:hypothetical protein